MSQTPVSQKAKEADPVLSQFSPSIFSHTKASGRLTAVQKRQRHSRSVVILSKDSSQRHSLQVTRGAGASSPTAGFSVVMVRYWVLPPEPISLSSPVSRLLNPYRKVQGRKYFIHSYSGCLGNTSGLLHGKPSLPTPSRHTAKAILRTGGSRTCHLNTVFLAS